jgi:hypothetical protein
MEESVHPSWRKIAIARFDLGRRSGRFSVSVMAWFRQLSLTGAIMLTERIVAVLAALPYQPGADWEVNVLPFGSIVWKDEMPAIGDLFDHPEDMAIIHAMFDMRLKIWDGEALNVQEQELWDAVKRQVPYWALFKRLNLPDEQRLARKKAERQVELAFGSPEKNGA